MSHQGSYYKGKAKSDQQNVTENYCQGCQGGREPPRGDYRSSIKNAQIRENYGTYKQGCNHSLGGDFNIMGNSATDRNFGKEGYCRGCHNDYNLMPIPAKEEYCGNAHNDYDVFNYDMVETYSTPYRATYIPQPPMVPPLPPYYFIGNSKLTIEDPDNALTYWLGGPPCPCKSGMNQPATGRNQWYNNLVEKKY